MNFKIKTEQGSTYLELPCREERIAEFCKAVGIPNTSATEVAVEGVYPSDRANILLQDKTFNLDKLNFLAKRLDSFDGKEMTTFYTIAYGEQIEDMVINVSVRGPGGTDKTTINCKIVDLDKNPPPNPVADDRNDSFRQESVPTRADKARADWSVWRPWWQEYWVDRGHWESDDWTDSEGNSHSSSYWVSNWVDEGWWGFDLNR